MWRVYNLQNKYALWKRRTNRHCARQHHQSGKPIAAYRSNIDAAAAYRVNIDATIVAT